MKRYLATLALASAMVPAHALEFEAAASDLCGALAEYALSIAKDSRKGISWAHLEKTVPTSKRFPKLKNLQLILYRDAYFSYASFDAATIQQLTYAKCQLLVNELR